MPLNLTLWCNPTLVESFKRQFNELINENLHNFIRIFLQPFKLFCVFSCVEMISSCLLDTKWLRYSQFDAKNKGENKNTMTDSFEPLVFLLVTHRRRRILFLSFGRSGQCGRLSNCAQWNESHYSVTFKLNEYNAQRNYVLSV